MHILDKLHWCVMETSFLVQLDYGHVNFGWSSSAHTYGEYAENVIVSGVCFYFSFRPDDMVNKMQEESLCTRFMNTTVHETDLCTFWTIQTFVSVFCAFSQNGLFVTLLAGEH